MIRLGVRLAVAGGREAVGRLALIAVAVAVGTVLLLTTRAATNALDMRADRYAWLESGKAAAELGIVADSDVDPVWWLVSRDMFQGDEIGRVDVAATGPDAPVPPGIPALPGPGEYYASPALAELLEATPADQLGDRFPGVRIGTLGSDALPAPDTLLVVVGREVDELSGLREAAPVSRINTTVPDQCIGVCAPGLDVDGEGLTLVLTVVAAALLFPVLMFIGGATRLAAARREQRFAAMRLVGGTPRQISLLATVESAVATVAGVAAGVGAFYALRPAIATIRFAGDPFFAADLVPTPRDLVLVALGIPVAAAVAARLAMRRVNISPLGVTRRVTPRPPRAWRLIPLVAGLAELAYLAYLSDLGENGDSQTQAYAYLFGVLAVMIGLVVAGPWLTMLGSELMARRARRPAGLIAARRLGDDPRAAFRAISGLVLAVFVATCTIGIVGTIAAYIDGDAGDPAASAGTLVQFTSRVAPSEVEKAEETQGASPGVEDLADLVAIPGVDAVTPVHIDLRAETGGPDRAWFYVSCAQIVRTPVLGTCPDGAEVAEIVPHFGGAVVDSSATMAETTWPEADLSTADLDAMPVDVIVVATDGTTAAVERARTVLGERYPQIISSQTVAEIDAHNARQLTDYRRLADVVLFASLPIAGCSLAVSIAGGLADRRRPFGLLRLTGVPLALLRRVVAMETAVPLLIGTVVSVGTGLLSAGLFLRAQTSYTLQAPGLGYWALVGGGVVASLAIVGSTLPLLARTTGPDSVRE